MKPSIKTLTKQLGLTVEQAKELRSAMDRNKGMSCADRLLGGFGVERIPHERNAKSPAIQYVNMGDTYNVTLLKVSGSYRVGDWGSIVERGSYE